MTDYSIIEALDAFIQQRLGSSDSVEELEGIVGQIWERQEQAAQARDAQNHAIGRIQERLAALEAVMIGQVADSDPGEIEELSEHQAQQQEDQA